MLYPTALRRIFRADWSAQLVRFTVCLLAGGLICIWFAWNLTRPVRGLRTAAVRLASGDLTVRVGPGLRNRSDEFAELGRDFDVMAERLEHLVEAHRQLLSDVSHELRSPLARLSVALGLARQKSGPETTDLLDRIERETERLNGLIGQLLSLAQIESGTGFHRERFDLYLLLEAAVADGDFEARARGCSVELHGVGPYWVDGSVELLRSATENVIRNAIRHSPEGGAVDVSILQEEEGAHSTAVVTVRDHGAGVPETALPRLFEPFFRVQSGSRKDARGTGLGLAITQRAIRLHNGSVRAQNAPNGGLLVTIRVPLCTS
jgi:two-component system sensor histidine kinase CpxA